MPDRVVYSQLNWKIKIFQLRLDGRLLSSSILDVDTLTWQMMD